jgi:paraquat-inducible protein B
MNANEAQGASIPEASIPEARVVTATEASANRWRTKLWWLTAACVLVAIGLVVSSFRTQGTVLHIRFEEGHGLKAGDTLHYRGIDVGTVTKVVVAEDMKGVDVSIQLTQGSENLAVDGSEFWIQRARLRLGQVTGLETVLGAKYVGVLPGPDASKPKREFVGLETPLGMTEGEATEIRIQFPAGEGLEVGDPVRYRGIAVGEVTDVDLNASAEAVLVGVRLVGAAKAFAQAGTQFWIEKPRLDVTEIRGLETLLGGRYLAIQPDSASSTPQREFVGLAEPPPLPRRNGSLEIELDAADRAGLVRGAPVTYRGLEVGRIANVGLSNDGATVRIQVVIEPEYAELVRDNSKWWSISGVQFDLGIKGVQLSIDSLASWIRGGIAFATPDQPGARVVTGYRFTLAEEPAREWLRWQPRIAVGHSGGVDRQELPKPIRVAATWKASWLGLYRRQSAQTWGLALDDGTLLVPTNFVRAAAATKESVTIEVAGNSFAFIAEEVTTENELSKLSLPDSIEVEKWPVGQFNKQWNAKSVLLIMNPELSEPIAIDASRISNHDSSGLSIVTSIAINETLAGSAVTEAESGQLVGLLTKVKGVWTVAQ